MGSLPAAAVARAAGQPSERLIEEDLRRLWYEGGFARSGLRTRCGQRVRVVYRGLPNGDRGPDYRGAVLSVGRGRPRAGDIELHVRTSQWRAHGHHRDPNYNGVVLHVVWQDDDSLPTVLQNGRQIPVLALSGFPAAGRHASIPIEPCRQPLSCSTGRLERELDRAGEARFLEKAARMEGDMAAIPANEVLYQSLAEAMGYSQNKVPFRRLASSLPLGILEGFLWGKPMEGRKVHAQALLLGTAGLLPSQRQRTAGEGWPALLQDAWDVHGLDPQLKTSEWRLGVRPENYPVRRLVGLANLVAFTLEEGLLSWALSSVEAANMDSGKGGRHLSLVPYSWFRGTAAERGDYWQEHFDFGLVGRRLGSSLIGPDRALEVAVNVLLPFAYSYGQVLGDEGLSRQAMEAYTILPAPASNQVTRHMIIQLFGAGDNPLRKTARRQQGLLHLFHSYCTRARCTECGLSEPRGRDKTQDTAL